MRKKSKTGSSRRKGDEYQDLTALRLALELYLKGKPFDLFIEYEKAKSMDDVVVYQDDDIKAYQIKHAVDNHAVYQVSDLTDPKSKIHIKKFADSWKTLCELHPGSQLALFLRSNRLFDKELSEFVDPDGRFNNKFCENLYRTNRREIRLSIREASGLDEGEFQEFLSCFRWELRCPNGIDLEQYIIADLLDHQLGISDRNVFLQLKRLIEKHAIEIHEPVTLDLINQLLTEHQTRFSLPQHFHVDQERFVRLPELTCQLDQTLNDADGEYVVITGLPGSGKSTSISDYLNQLENSDKYEVVRYYCFVRIDDDQQRLRFEADALRTNLLTKFQKVFPDILDRRLDFSETNFVSVIRQLGEHCCSHNKKLIVLLDGLDHVERDDSVVQTVINSLPTSLPSGIVFLIGTQELQTWKPLPLKEGRENRHISMPLFQKEQTREFLVNRCKLELTSNVINEIHEKSGGLPLYLQYVTQILSVTEDVELTLQNLNPVVDGDIHRYYELLWQSFVSKGSEKARHLSVVLSMLRFPVHQDQLYGFQNEIALIDINESYQKIRHLLRQDDNLVSVFHDSFRVFVLGKFDSTTKNIVARQIFDCLKQEKNLDRWFCFAHQYALDCKDHDYILATVSTDFVENALLLLRSPDDIKDWIDSAIKAARSDENIVALSRLGILKFRTRERLEDGYPWTELAASLVYLSQIEKIKNFILNSDGSLKVSYGLALTTAIACSEVSKSDFGRQIYSAVSNEYINDDAEFSSDEDVLLAKCDGIYKSKLRVVKWIIELQPQQKSYSDPEEFAPEYKPHLDTYIDSLVNHRHHRRWKVLKSLEELLPNKLVRHLILRALERHGFQNFLIEELAEYTHKFPNDTNLEIAFFSAVAGNPSDEVNRCAGTFLPPSFPLPGSASQGELETELRQFGYWSVVFSYCSHLDILNQVESTAQSSQGIWAASILHLAKFGIVLGDHYANRNQNWMNSVILSLQPLMNAGDRQERNTPNAIDACRAILSWTLYKLSKVVVTRCPECLDQWIEALKELRNSILWTVHYGINERVSDYSFELKIWEEIISINQIRKYFSPILLDCGKTISETPSLKGMTRSYHFMHLAKITARCNLKTKSEEWMKNSVQSSLAYGYHKDTTLWELIDVVELASKHNSEKTLQYSARILEMNKWMPAVSNGQETGEFASHLFPLVYKCNPSASLGLVQYLFRNVGCWQARECLKLYLEKREGSDPEFLWALSAMLRPNDSMQARKSIATLGGHEWSNRFEQYLKSMVNPSCWSQELKGTSASEKSQTTIISPNESQMVVQQEPTEFDIGGKQLSIENIMERTEKSLESMIAICESLHEKNHSSVVDKVWENTIPKLIAKINSNEELKAIESEIIKDKWWNGTGYLSLIAEKYLEFNDIESAINSYATAYSSITEEGTPLAEIYRLDSVRARQVLVNELFDKLGTSYGVFSAPKIAAVGCEIIDSVDELNQITEQYLLDTEKLFEHLPINPQFDWLAEYESEPDSENIQILKLLVGNLSDPEVEWGILLVKALFELCIARKEIVVPFLVNELPNIKGLQHERVLQVLFTLSHQSPDMLRPFAEKFCFLLELPNTRVKLLVTQLLHQLYLVEDMPEIIVDLVEQIHRDYSSSISYRGFRILQISPSNQFRELVRKSLLIPFRKELQAICDLLNLEEDSVIGWLERQFLEDGGNIEEELETWRDEYENHSHAQGNPVIGFIPSFQQKMETRFQQLLDEALRKNSYESWQLKKLWHILQPVDPAYVAFKISPKPNDISPLIVEDKNEWFDECSEEIELSEKSIGTKEWVTVYGICRLVQDSHSYESYVSQIQTRSTLAQPKIAEEIRLIEHYGSWNFPLLGRSSVETFTWNDFQESLTGRMQVTFGRKIKCISLVSFEQTPRGFIGFNSIASLSPHVLDALDLEWDGFSLTWQGELVGKFEVWQEGYPNEYNDFQPLAFGERLQIRADLLNKISDHFDRTVVILESEIRVHVNQFQKEPKKQVNKRRYFSCAMG